MLKLIVKSEYLADIKRPAFWIGTFAMPLLMLAFGIFIGFMAEDSESLKFMTNPTAPDPKSLSGMEVAGMIVGLLLTLFVMIYGAQIFSKVRKEKSNRIMEVLATCVDGRTMMFGKIISVGLLGLTQVAVWIIFAVALLALAQLAFGISIPFGFLSDPRFATIAVWGILFFIGGYVFFGSLYAAAGAITDKNQENQEYMTILTFILLGSFYIGQFAVDHSGSAFVAWCAFIPFTSATVGAVNAISGVWPWWLNILSLLSLYAFAALSLIFTGKLYTSTLLLKGRKLSPRDLVAFLKTK